MLEPFRYRGMGEMRGRIQRLMETREAMQATLDTVRRHGNSIAKRIEQPVRQLANDAAARASGQTFGAG